MLERFSLVIKFSPTNTLSYPSTFWVNGLHLIVVLTNTAAQTWLCHTLELVDVVFEDLFPIMLEGLAACKSLTDLNLSSFVGDHGIHSLAKVLDKNKKIKLENITLNKCGIGIEGLKEILRIYRGSKVDLKSNNFREESAAVISQFIKERADGLTYLNLSHNPFGPKGIQLLMDGLVDTKLEKKNLIKSDLEIDLSDCDIDKKGAEFIGNLLKINPNLGSLKLAENYIEDEVIR
jgi:Ran GTPase-activating protein (RanGAP) involved in mRNA processing and transport